VQVHLIITLATIVENSTELSSFVTEDFILLPSHGSSHIALQSYVPMEDYGGTEFNAISR
jgi:hypothetical protein